MTTDSTRPETADLGHLRESLAEALTAVGDDPTAQAEAVLRCLGERQIIHYAPAGTLPLLTPAGRVLVLVARYPEITLRELGNRLGITESSIGRQVTFLVEAGLVKRTRFRNRNRYELAGNALSEHPDITHWVGLLGTTGLDRGRDG